MSFQFSPQTLIFQIQEQIDKLRETLITKQVQLQQTQDLDPIKVPAFQSGPTRSFIRSGRTITVLVSPGGINREERATAQAALDKRNKTTSSLQRDITSLSKQIEDKLKGITSLEFESNVRSLKEKLTTNGLSTNRLSTNQKLAVGGIALLFLT